MPKIKQCEYCGNEFKIKPSKINKSKYCSKGCHNKSMIKTIIKVCPQCNVEFSSKPSEDKVYCSNKCKSISQSANISYELIYDLYVVQNISTREMGKILDISKTTVKRTLEKFDIQIRDCVTQRKGSDYITPTKEELENLYIKEYMSYENISKKYNVDMSTVGIWIKKYGIKPRKGGESKKGKEFIMPTKEQIINLYIKKELSTSQIANLFYTTDTTISKITKEYGIELRTNLWNGRKFIKCDDGHIVRSNLERIVDDYFNSRGIDHEYEKRLPDKYFRYMSDFYANDTYIEIWGVTNNKKYSEQRDKKEKIYKILGLKLVSIEADDFRDLPRLYNKLSQIS